MLKRLRGYEPAKRRVALRQLEEVDPRLKAVLTVVQQHDWSAHARAKQLEPAGDWRYWVILAGRGFGKTRTGAEWIREKAESGKYRWISIVGPTYNALQTYMVAGPAGLLNISPGWARPEHVPSKALLRYPNGVEVRYFTAERPERLRGPEHEIVWMDELAAWPHLDDAFANIDMGLRKGASPRALITTTPKPKPELIDLVLGPRGSDGTRTPRPDVVVVRGSSEENDALTPDWIAAMRSKYGHSRLGRQELDAELLERTGSELWHMRDLELLRVDGVPCAMQRVVVAIDPTRSDSPTDECGIVVAGRGEDGIAYVLRDGSTRATPAGWLKRALELAREFRADAIVYEKNRMGSTAEHTMRMADTRVEWVAVTATAGKRTRAEPVSALYEQGKVRHVGSLDLLEDEMTSWGPGAPSPNRMDALVWAITELMLGEKRAPLVAL